jgi:hypothetical protein
MIGDSPAMMHRGESHLRVYLHGYHAYGKGTARHGCPYDSRAANGSRGYAHAWLAGWDIACHEAVRGGLEAVV